MAEWKKVKLKEVLKQNNEKILIEDSKEYRQITVSNTGEIKLRGIKKGSQIGTKKQTIVHKGEFVYSRLGIHQGAFGIVPKELDGAVVTGDMPIFKIDEKQILPEILIWLLGRKEVRDIFEDLTRGLAQSRIREKYFLDIAIDLPDLPEQRKILKKIQSIEKEIKQLENNISHDEKLLTTLKQSILSEAVQGKLVKQNPKDEPASELLKKIKAEKEKLIKEGKIKKEKPLKPISDDEIPYELPRGWAWVRSQQVFDVRDGTHDTPKYTAQGIPLITSKCFENGKINFELAKNISLEDHKEIIKRSLVEKEDILFSMIGGNLGNMVKVETSKEFSIKNVALFKYYNKNLTPPTYLEILLKDLSRIIQSKSAGGAQPFVPLNFFRDYLFPLPPLSEQIRIVQKVDKLMAYCDELEDRINKNKNSSERLMGAVLKESFEK